MRGRDRVVRVLSAAAAAVALAATEAEALGPCRARVDPHDGTILVFARDVTGTPRWGVELGDETRAFEGGASCVSATGHASRCALGPVGSPERTTTPPGCVVFLADDGGGRCPAWIRKCYPASPPPIPCPLFPADNVWSADVSSLPVHAMSETWIASIGGSVGLHADFGSGRWKGAPIGIPYTVVPGIQPRVPVSFLYADESDPGPYPIPAYAPVEGGARLGVGKGDAHVLVVERESCTLHEVYAARRRRGGAEWTAGSGAAWSLTSNELRPAGWTSADAAGLPILPGLVRYDEVAAGDIGHAIRFTAPRTQRAWVWPARHFASSSSDPTLPPMGIRVRLKESVDLSGFSPANRVILTALKRHGMMLADNGSPWFLSGTPDARWDDDDLHELDRILGSDFEVVDTSSLIVDPDSGETR